MPNKIIIIVLHIKVQNYLISLLNKNNNTGEGDENGWERKERKEHPNVYKNPKGTWMCGPCGPENDEKGA